MAAQTEIGGLLGQKLDIIGYVRVVAGKALFLRRKSLVLYQCGPDFLFLVLVAGQTEILRAIRLEVVLEIGAVGVMALHAGFYNRRMGKFLVLEGFGLVGMAFEADGIGRCPE